MQRLALLATLATLALFSFAACGASTTADPTATPEPKTVPSGDISTLLFPSDVSGFAGVEDLTTAQRDQKSAAAQVDTDQVEHMDSFDSLSFDTEGGARSLVLTTIDFDSEGAVTDHAGLLLGEDSGMSDLTDTIGDASGFLEANEGGIGSMVVFRKGELVILLHTAQGAGIAPLVDLGQLTALARLVADRLPG